MEFGAALRTLRKEAGMSQAQLAQAAGVTARTIQYYEAGNRQPQSTAVVAKLARALGQPVTALLPALEDDAADTRQQLLEQAQQTFGTDGRTQLNKLLQDASALLAGGQLEDADQVAFMRAINDIYYDARQKAGPQPPKQYRIEDYQTHS